MDSVTAPPTSMLRTDSGVEVALHFADPRSLERLSDDGADSASRLYFGNEFCDHLIPSPRTLSEVLARARELALDFSLVTPMVTDSGISALGRLFRILPEGSEVIVSDWGVLRLAHAEFPSLLPVAGRLLCKIMKDPRLPSRDWTKLVPHGFFASPFLDLLASFGIGRLDLDLPPHARPEDFHGSSMRLSMHGPYGFAAKGRICRVGSLHLDRERKFVPGEPCGKECLDYVLAMSRGAAAGAGDLHTFQRGNTVFYRHSDEMEATLEELTESGVVDRLVVSGDWNENRGAA